MKTKTKTPRIKALCKKGKQLRRDWASSLNVTAHRMHGDYPHNLDDSWQKQWGQGYRPYSEHVAGCLTCRAYLVNRRTK